MLDSLLMQASLDLLLLVFFFFHQYAVDGLEEDVVDYGTVGTGENRTKLLKIFNNNPIEVCIHMKNQITHL